MAQSFAVTHLLLVAILHTVTKYRTQTDVAVTSSHLLYKVPKLGTREALDKTSIEMALVNLLGDKVSKKKETVDVSTLQGEGKVRKMGTMFASCKI